MTEKNSNSSDTFTYLIMKHEDIEASARILAESFCYYNAPTIHLKMKVEEMYDYSVSLCEQVVDEELSMVAKTNDGTIVACKVVHDFNTVVKSSKPHGPLILLIYDFLDTLDRHAFPIMHALPWFDAEKCTFNCLTGIDSNFSNRGIAKELVKRTCEFHCSKGYKFTYGQYTNPITLNIFLKQYDGTELYSLAYEDFWYTEKREDNTEEGDRTAVQPFLGLPGKATAAVAHLK